MVSLVLHRRNPHRHGTMEGDAREGPITITIKDEDEIERLNAQRLARVSFVDHRTGEGLGPA